jgi:hypothetical protein
MAVTFGAALGVVVLTGAGCGGTLEGRYRRGELGPGSTTTTGPRAGAPADAGVQSAPVDAPVLAEEEPAP